MPILNPIIERLVKGSRMTFAEHDTNFTNLLRYQGLWDIKDTPLPRNTVVIYQGGAWVALADTSEEPSDAAVNWVRLQPGGMRWEGTWAAGEYHKYAVVMDWPYTMIANKTTTDRPAPQTQGDPAYLYTGASPTTSVTAKQLILGARYTPAGDTPFYINGYRIFTVTGNNYDVFSVRDGVLNQLISFTADATGWQDYTVPPILTRDDPFDLLALTTEPDPSPTTWTGDWNYQTPNNPGNPASGVVQHSNQNQGELRFHKTDNIGGDRSTDLLALAPGDIINGPGGIRWAIQTVTDAGVYVGIAVAPANQSAPDGVFSFLFETVTATPITYVEDFGFWTGDTRVQGMKGVDIPYASITPDANQYGVDILVQEAAVSEDWDTVAYSG